MRPMICENCGASGLKVISSFLVCEYCDSKFLLTTDDYMFSETRKMEKSGRGISLGSDIEMLLQKCRMNPRNARKYANLILDIDPDNKEALKYI